MTKQKYKVIVDENFHFMDESERFGSGGYETFEEAKNKCERIIDEFLVDAITEDDTASSLFMTWRMYGENPFIAGGKRSEKFNASDYTQKRCKELAG